MILNVKAVVKPKNRPKKENFFLIILKVFFLESAFRNIKNELTKKTFDYYL